MLKYFFQRNYFIDMSRIERGTTPDNIINKEILIIRSFEIKGLGKFDEINLNKKGLRCVDPRPSAPIESDGKSDRHKGKEIGKHSDDEIKFFGGVIGLMTAYATAAPSLSAEKVVDIVTRFEKKKGRKPAFHDDTKDGCGCGFVSRAIEEKNQNAFGIKSEKVVEIKKAFSRQINDGLEVKKIILEGPHEEEAVLIIKSDKEINETVRSADANQRIFIYDETASNGLLTDLALFSKEENIEVKKEDIITAARRQAGATLRLLAAGLPVYEIDLTNPIPKVTPKGTVPALA